MVIGMSATTTTFDAQKIIDWLKQNWVLVVILLIALVLFLRMIRRRRRLVIEI